MLYFLLVFYFLILNIIELFCKSKPEGNLLDSSDDFVGPGDNETLTYFVKRLVVKDSCFMYGFGMLIFYMFKNYSFFCLCGTSKGGKREHRRNQQTPYRKI